LTGFLVVLQLLHTNKDDKELKKTDERLKTSKQARKRSEPGSTQNVFALQKWMRLAWWGREGAWRGTKPGELDDSFG
jgi:hypothetical protein